MKSTPTPRSGFETSSPPDTSRPAMLTSDRSRMSSQATSPDTRNATSSPVSEAGAEPSASPAGTIADLFGPALAPASPSRSRGRKKVSAISATSGLNFTGSSRSDLLQSFLESRLRTRLLGSAACEVIWKPWVTPWGQSLWKPRARVRTISEIVFGLWPTMTSNAKATQGYNEAGNSAGQVAIRKIIMGLYPTATTPSGGQTVPLGTSLTGRRPDGTKAQVTLQNVLLSLWSTLRASDGAKGGPNMSFGAGGSPLPSQVFQAANSSNAPMENGVGSLHPEFAGWELGYPPVWLSCAPSETPSTSAPPPSSSALTGSANDDHNI